MKEGKYALVPDNMVGEYSSNLLSFEYNEVLPDDEAAAVRLLKSEYYSLVFCANGRTKTLVYIEFIHENIAYSRQKPYDDSPLSYSSGGLHLMDFFWMGGR